MQTDQLSKTTQTLDERGIPSHSYFKVTFMDGSEISEHDLNWSAISEKQTVEYFGHQKVVHICKIPVKRIECFHEGLQATIDVPDGCQPYQAIRGHTLIVPNVQRRDQIIGRLIGIVKDGEILEELYLDGLQYKVAGLKK